MGIRFSKSVKLGKYLRLNFSKSGVSATVGPKGASVNVGSKGTFLNLSPALVGVNGTGISYRKKLFDTPLGKKEKKEKEYVPANAVTETTSSSAAPSTPQYTSSNPYTITSKETVTPERVVEEYARNHEAKINIHKYADPVMNSAQFEEYVASLESAASKELYRYAIEGDEDTIENFVGSFMGNLDLAYDLRANYELEDDALYVDLDLPEIENINTNYPVVKDLKLVYKKKTNAELKEEYARTVLSLAIFLSANFFNVSPYITTVVFSGFTTIRNKDGDLVDQYIYSVKFTRDVFENTDLSKIDEPYEFVLQFQNRINMSKTYTFKAIKPYEMESIVAANLMVEDAALALKELGYKTSDINYILPELMSLKLDSVSDYVRAGLSILNEMEDH